MYLNFRFCKNSSNLEIFDLNGYKGDESANENIFENLNTKLLNELHVTNSTLSSKDCKKLFEVLTRVI
jgi:hypothetical protein